MERLPGEHNDQPTATGAVKHCVDTGCPMRTQQDRCGHAKAKTGEYAGQFPPIASLTACPANWPAWKKAMGI